MTHTTATDRDQIQRLQRRRVVPSEPAFTAACNPSHTGPMFAALVTRQLWGSQHRPSFLPGSGARLNLWGRLKALPRASGLGTARPRPEPRLMFAAVCPAAVSGWPCRGRLAAAALPAASGPPVPPLSCSTCSAVPRWGSSSGIRGSRARWLPCSGPSAPRGQPSA